MTMADAKVPIPMHVHLDRLDASAEVAVEDPSKPSSNRSAFTMNSTVSGKDARKFKRRLMAVMKKSENKICAECAEKRPTYAAFVRPPVNKHGVPLVPGSNVYCAFCCLQCATAHRNLDGGGLSPVSPVKSTRTDEWTEDDLLAAELGGNKRITEIYEASLHNNPAHSTVEKPRAGSHAATRDRFVQNKYIDLLFYSQAKHAEWVQKQALAGGSSTPKPTMRKKRISGITGIGSDILKSPGDNTEETIDTATSAQTPSPSNDDENGKKPARRTSLAVMLSKTKGANKGNNNHDEDEKSFVSNFFSSTPKTPKKSQPSNEESFNNSIGALSAASPGALTGSTTTPTPRKKRASLVGLFRSAGNKSPRAAAAGSASVTSSGISLADNLSMVSSNTPGSDGSKPKYNRNRTAPSNRLLIKHPSSDLKEFANTQKSSAALDVSLHDSDSFNEAANFDEETEVPGLNNHDSYKDMGKPDSQTSRGRGRPKLLSAPSTPKGNTKTNARMNLYSAGGGVRNKNARETRDRSRSVSRDRNGKNDSNSDLQAMMERDGGSSSSLRRPRSTSRARDSISCSNERLGTDVATQSPTSRRSRRGRSRGRGHTKSESEIMDQNNASFVSKNDENPGRTRSPRRGRGHRSRSTSRARDGERKDYYDSSSKANSGRRNGRSRSSSRNRNRRDDDGDYYKKSGSDEAERPISRRSKSSDRGLSSSRTMSSQDEDDNLQPQSTRSSRRPASHRGRSRSTDHDQSHERPSSSRSRSRSAEKLDSKKPSSRRTSRGAEKRIPSDPLRGRDRGRAARSRTRSSSRTGGDRTRSSSRTTNSRSRGSSRGGTRSRSSSRARGDMGATIAASRKRAEEKTSKLRDQSRERFKSTLANQSLQASLNASKLNASKLNASALNDRSLSVDDFMKQEEEEPLNDSNGSLESETSNLSKNVSALFSGTLTPDTLTTGEKGKTTASGRVRKSNKRNPSEGSLDNRSGHSCASSGDSSLDEDFLKEQAERKERIKKKDFKQGGEAYLRMQRRAKDRVVQRKQQRDSIKNSLFAALDREEEELVKTTAGPLMRARAAPSRSKSADLNDMHVRPLMGVTRTRSAKQGSILAGRSRLSGGGVGGQTSGLNNGSYHGLALAGGPSSNVGGGGGEGEGSRSGSSHLRNSSTNVLDAKPSSSRQDSGAWQKRKAINKEMKDNFEASLSNMDLDFDMDDDEFGGD